MYQDTTGLKFKPRTIKQLKQKSNNLLVSIYGFITEVVTFGSARLITTLLWVAFLS